jgi:hypothetical protein
MTPVWIWALIPLAILVYLLSHRKKKHGLEPAPPAEETVEQRVNKIMADDKISGELSTEDKRLRRETLGTAYLAKEKKWDRWTRRNLEAAEYERLGHIDKAIELLTENVAERADTPYSAGRLVVLLRKQGRLDEEITVMEKARRTFPKMFEKRLALAMAARAKRGGPAKDTGGI